MSILVLLNDNISNIGTMLDNSIIYVKSLCCWHTLC